MPVLAPIYPGVNALPLLADAGSLYRKLKTDAERTDQIVVAELLLGLRPPAYAGRAQSEIEYAVALQVQFQMQQGVTPEITKSVSQAHPGNTTTYRDRYLSPEAAAIVARATNTATTGFTIPPGGV
jgi:hypothetical protein